MGGCNPMANPAAEDPAESDLAQKAESGEAIRVIVADSESIFRVGVRKIMALEDDIRIVAQVESAEAAVTAVGRFSADVLLLEMSSQAPAAKLLSNLLSVQPQLKIVVVVAELSEPVTVEYLRLGIRGILLRSISPDLLVRCIRKVYAGETWLNNQGVNWVIEAYRTQAMQLTTPQNQIKLSPKELQIIAGVTQGLRNKDIAAEVATTEQVVKNYLRKVYDKLGVSDRLELALYCIHHRLLENYVHKDGKLTPLHPTQGGGTRNLSAHI